MSSLVAAGHQDMSLRRYKVAAAVAVADMTRARAFYEGVLGLAVGTDAGDNVAYACGEGSILHVFLSPDHAGHATATQAGWYVDDLEPLVDELTAAGVRFERYDEAPIVTDDKGIATFEGGARVAYFADPDGNMLSIAQPADAADAAGCVIVAGALYVDPGDRDEYLAGCVAVVELARAAPGHLDFALSPDPVDPARINVYERWASRADLERFRGSGPSADQAAHLRDVRVGEYAVNASRA
jgi:catechol 2,3-dioxygenase-like lactoylglutathione lyase family enzyme/quinol monooxygenase YgiN